MKKYATFWTLVVIVGIVEVFSLLPERPREENGSSQVRTSKPQIVQGIIHVHSNFSDGGGAPDEIAEAAKAAGHDFVVLTDHNNYEARKRGYEKAYGKTDLFVETESSLPVGHTVSFFSLSDKLKNSDSQSIEHASYKQFLKTEETPGLFIAVAHPSNVKNPWSRLDEYAAGWEVVNFDSSWQRQLADRPFQFILTAALYPFNEYLSALRFFEVYRKDFISWDEMTSRGAGHFAYLAHDTHSKLKLTSHRSLSWPGYLQTFKMATNVLFLREPKSPDFETRKKQYYQSLREGRLAIVYQPLAPFDGNDWKVVCGGQSFSVGETIKGLSNCEAHIETPETSFKKVVRLVRNGEIIREIVVEKTNSNPLKLPIPGNGIYRVEVLAVKHTALRLLLNRLVPYVFYNPIYLQ
jgi:hypothetical protein